MQGSAPTKVERETKNLVFCALDMFSFAKVSGSPCFALLRQMLEDALADSKGEVLHLIDVGVTEK